MIQQMTKRKTVVCTQMDQRSADPCRWKQKQPIGFRPLSIRYEKKQKLDGQKIEKVAGI